MHPWPPLTMDQEASGFQVMGRILWLARPKGVCLPHRIFISLTVSVCTGPLMGRGDLHQEETITSSRFCSSPLLSPTPPAASRDTFKQLCLPPYPPRCQPGQFLGGGRRAGCHPSVVQFSQAGWERQGVFCFFFFFFGSWNVVRRPPGPPAQ